MPTELTENQKLILKELELLWKKHPTQRFGQLLENYVFFEGQRGDETSIKMFYQDDTDSLQFLKDKKIRRRLNAHVHKKQPSSR